MSSSPSAELISTGAELLNGRTLNRHGQVLGSMLRSFGITLEQDTTVVDQVERIAEAVAGAVRRVPYVFVTGGLGPTEDDLTREAVAMALGATLVESEDAVRHQAGVYDRNGREYTGSRRRQAQVIDGAKVYMNPVGIAPGQGIEVQPGRWVFILPGPPREFLAIMEHHVLPHLAQQVGDAARPPESLFLFTGVGESDLHEYVGQHGLVESGVDIGWCAAPGRVELRLQSNDEEALDRSAGAVRQHLAAFIFSEERVGLEDVIVSLLRARGQEMAVAESCTGGLLGGRITEVPGSSAIFAGGVQSYANRIKEAALGVPPEMLASVGAVSEEVAVAMAEGAKERFSVDWTLSVTGVAGPDGGTPEKPVGTVWIGLAGPGGSSARKYTFSGNRPMIRERAIQAALERLRRQLLDIPESTQFSMNLNVSS